jgi:hypothetical protein
MGKAPDVIPVFKFGGRHLRFRTAFRRMYRTEGSMKLNKRKYKTEENKLQSDYSCNTCSN